MPKMLKCTDVTSYSGKIVSFTDNGLFSKNAYKINGKFFGYIHETLESFIDSFERGHFFSTLIPAENFSISIRSGLTNSKLKAINLQIELATELEIESIQKLIEKNQATFCTSNWTTALPSIQSPRL